MRVIVKLCLTARLLLTPLRGVHRRRAVLDCSAPPHAAARRASSPS
ncbi:hypothetical protein BIT17_3273 [Mycobacterium tuberculosis variant bovis]|nr:hypothetical protein BIT17_1419 [Mycobacterium tuberculosis variant bovis]KAF3414475.1 hypothetical protein BIT17_2888 [Mycobacterium tuberculosis variant bovis]KAF3418168.1 hypothetical protein BIT17_3273 [Mycobacterium tuberculosis variant bovis]